jgi:Spy/CpxP family protein refolding chaperone
MKNFKPRTAARLALFLTVGTLVASLVWPLAGAAQVKAPDTAEHKHADQSADADKDLGAQVRDLQAKIIKLEAALKQGHKGTSSGTSDTAGKSNKPMGMMGDQKMGQGMMGMGGMEAMKPDEMMGQMMQKMGQMMQMMGQMQGKGKGMGGGMGMMDMGGMMGGMGGGKKGTGGMPGIGGMGMEGGDVDMMGMMGMGSMGQGGMSGMKGMGKMKMISALPGFPGASHIYHVGATGFFLDHPEHIQLTTKQQADLNRIKEKALLEQTSSQRKIDETEQELWTLTASDKPDATKIEAKVREIEKLRGDQRLAFIRSVGEAAQVLTEEQRKALLGTAADKADKPGAHTGH